MKIIATLVIATILEVVTLLYVGKEIGIGWTFVLMVATSIIGFFFMQRQGIKVIREFQIRLNERQAPGKAIIEGIFVLIGGVLLIFPGLLSDIIGFLLLLPMVRHKLSPIVIKRLYNRLKKGDIVIFR